MSDETVEEKPEERAAELCVLDSVEAIMETLLEMYEEDRRKALAMVCLNLDMPKEAACLMAPLLQETAPPETSG